MVESAKDNTDTNSTKAKNGKPRAFMIDVINEIAILRIIITIKSIIASL
jgi:hypothetical protein